MAIDLAKVIEYRKKFEQRVAQGRQEILRNAYENVLYYLGHQWITFDISSKQFRRINMRKDVPRPVTNIYKSVLDQLDAVLARVEPQLTIAPGSDHDDDRLTADMGKQVIKYLEKATHMDEVRIALSKMVVLVNNAYLIAGYDADGGPRDRIPKWECPKHPDVHYSADKVVGMMGRCPKDKQQLVPSTDAFDEVPQGQMYVELASPFELWIDYTIKYMRDQPCVMWRRMKSLDWIKAKYPAAHDYAIPEEGYAAPQDIGLTYLQNIIRLTPGTAQTSFGSGARFKNSVVMDDIWVLPGEDFPNGLFARVVKGDQVLEAIELPTHDGTTEKPGEKFIPVTHFGYDDVPGTHFRTGPADHIKPLQRQRNRYQSSIELYFSRTANGVWAIPEGADIQNPKGEEGWVIRYNATAAGGGKPERIEGGRLPTAFTQWIQYIDQEMRDIAGLAPQDLPPRIDSGYAMTILNQRGQQRLASLFLGWERSYANIARQMFYVFRNYAPDEVFYAIKGEQARWSVAKIRAADLRGGVDIDVEVGSAQPKSSLEIRAALEQAAQMGIADLTDPKIRLQYARSLGVPQIMEEFNIDDEHIAREHAALLEWAKQVSDEQGNLTVPPDQGGMMPVFVDPMLDNHQMHYDRHRVWMLSEEFQALPTFVQQAWRVGHFMQHLMLLMQQQAQQTPAGTVPSPQQPGAPGGGGGGGSPEGKAQAAESATQQGRGYAGREQNRQLRDAGGGSASRSAA